MFRSCGKLPRSIICLGGSAEGDDGVFKAKVWA